MKKFYYLFLLLFVCMQAIAQNPISGKITDSATGEPIVGASIYVANTSYGAFSEVDGSFTLSDYPKEIFYLNFSSIGYETEIVEVNPENIVEITVKLTQKMEEIDAVVVYGKKEDLWPQYGEFFRELFIGYSKQAEQCKILNKKDIFFDDDVQTRTFTVYSKKPIVIQNKALGYEIEFWLEQFQYDYTTGYLIFQGYPFYRDLYAGKKNKKIKRNRKEAYLGSNLHFLRAVYNGDHKAEDFLVHKLQRRRISELYPESAKKVDTLSTNEDAYERFSALINNDEETIHLLEKYNTWKNYTQDSLIRFSVLKKLETGISKSEMFEFFRPSNLEEQIVFTRYNRQYLIEKKGNNGLYDVLKEKDIPTSGFAKTVNGKRVLSFDDFLLIVYLNEIEDAEYQLKGGFDKEFKEVNQSSVISVITEQGVEILPEGIVTDPSQVYIEQYWNYEKMDKMLPLNYEPPVE